MRGRRWRRWRRGSGGIRRRELRVVGVTGTNGKTTTAFLLREILEAAGRSDCGLLGTVKQVVGGVEEEVERTTPEAIDLQATFRRMLEAGDRACAMEVSSHALSLHRADAIHFEVALFTNLTQDHLDFHADMEDYFLAKRQLFEAGPGTAIVNVDDPYGRRLAEEFECVTFSAEGAEADYTARDVCFDAARRRVHVVEAAGRGRGRRCGRRAAGALQRRQRARGVRGGARRSGCEPEIAAAGLARAARVPGRFEPIDEGQGFAVLVDYAHTPDSLENVLRAARRLTAGPADLRLRRRRRPRPRQAAEDGPGGGRALATWRVVTSDNPRSEDPEAIVAEVAGRGRGGRRGRGRGRPPRRDRPGARPGRAGRHGRDRRQGARAGPGVRGRPQDPLRRPRGRPRGAAEAGQPGVKPRRRSEIAGGARRRGPSPEGVRARPARATIDSARRGPGDLFFGLRGANRDGGEFAAAAIAAGAWGVVVRPSGVVLPSLADGERPR